MCPSQTSWLLSHTATCRPSPVKGSLYSYEWIVMHDGGGGGGVGSGSGAVDTVETTPAQAVLSLETEEVSQAIILLLLSV